MKWPPSDFEKCPGEYECVQKKARGYLTLLISFGARNAPNCEPRHSELIDIME